MNKTRSTYLALLAVLLSPIGAQAGLIAVFPDVNMFDDGALALAGNQNTDVLSNLLGSGSTVLYSNKVGAFRSEANIVGHYNSLGGVTAISSASEVSAGSLAGVDLLFLDIGFLNLNPYTLAEQAAIAAYFGAGGSIGLISETQSNVASTDSINGLLAAIGSSMTLNSASVNPGYQLADTVLNTTLTAGVSSFAFGFSNTFDLVNGGIAAVQDQGSTIVAFEERVSTVPEPGTLALFGIGLAGMGLVKRRRKV